MNLRAFVAFLLLAEAFAVTTFGLGWWAVPIVAALWAAFTRSSRRAGFAALCAATGWGCLLVLNATRGPVGEVAAQLSGVMRVPAPLLYAVTLGFPALLAWSAAAIAARLTRRQAASTVVA
ncbi:MAG: hypothetical protein H0U59_00345 [Gemmatimonadaceae bacterium]|nr:hypothetical protein [Gemmatimonadaceae bacterium]